MIHQSLDLLARALRSPHRQDRCQVVRLRDFQLIADRIEDLSPDGMLVGPADPVLTGEPVLVSFRVPGLADYVDAEAIVTRVVHGRRPGEIRRELGLSLIGHGSLVAAPPASLRPPLPPIPPRYRRGVWRPMLARS